MKTAKKAPWGEMHINIHHMFWMSAEIRKERALPHLSADLKWSTLEEESNGKYPSLPGVELRMTADVWKPLWGLFQFKLQDSSTDTET